jgi:hypothetical protein
MKKFAGYTVGYELLLMNGLLTGLGLWLLSVRRSDQMVRQ